MDETKYSDEINNKIFLQMQHDPLMGNVEIKEEIHIKTEPGEFCEIEEKGIIQQQELEQEYEDVENKEKNNLRKSGRKKRTPIKQLKDDSGGSSGDEAVLLKQHKQTIKSKEGNNIRKTNKVRKTDKGTSKVRETNKGTSKVRETNKTANKVRKVRTKVKLEAKTVNDKQKVCKDASENTNETFLTLAQQKLPDIKNAIVENLSNENNGLLKCLKHKGVELTRKKKKKGFLVNDEDLNRFKRCENDKVVYGCDDCDFTTEQLKKFKLHFILHANNHYIMGIINQIRHAFYCYICKKNCLSDQELNQHLQKHQSGEEIIKPNKMEWDCPIVWPEPESPLRNDESDDDYDDMPLSNYVVPKDETKEIIKKGQMTLEVEFAPEICLENKSEIVIKKEIEMNNCLEVEFNADGIYSDCDDTKFNGVDRKDDVIEQTLPLQSVVINEGDNKVCVSCNYKPDPGKSFEHDCKLVRQCDLCCKVLITQRMLLRHRKLHFCLCCPFESTDVEEVLRHRKMNVDCWFKCKKCNFKTLSNDYYTRHIQKEECSDSNNKPQSKEKYSNAIAKKDDESVDCNDVLRKRMYKKFIETCKKCGYETDTRKPLKHRCHEVQKCNLCKKILRNKRICSYHMKLHSCEKCSYESSDVKKVIEHKKISPKCWYECAECNFKTINSNYFEKHIRKKGCDSVKNKIEKVCVGCVYEEETGNGVDHNCKEVRQCDLCKKIMWSQSSYRRHRRAHSCNKCSYKSSSTEDVIEHKKNSSNCWSHCGNCDFKTINAEYFQAHISEKSCYDKDRLERSEQTLYCDICPFISHYKSILQSHLKRHETDQKFVCKICKFSCSSKESLQNHTKVHYCQTCSFMAVRIEEMHQHRKNNPSCLMKCKYCDFTSVYKGSVAKHINTKCPFNEGKVKKKINKWYPYKCDLCDYKTSSLGYFERHEAKHNDPTPLQCKLCSYKANYKASLLVHEKTHIVDKTYQCTLCNFECSRLKSFETHKKMHGIDGNKLPEQTGSSERDPRFVYCDKCEYRTKHSYNLKYHMKKHDDIAAHLCPHCGRSFHSLIDFHVHKQTHKEKNLKENVKDKVFKCSYCDYSHYLKSSVKIHERKHTGAKPYSCNVCSYTTSYAGNLSAHRKKHFEIKANNSSYQWNN